MSSTEAVGYFFKQCLGKLSKSHLQDVLMATNLEGFKNTEDKSLVAIMERQLVSLYQFLGRMGEEMSS